MNRGAASYEKVSQVVPSGSDMLEVYRELSQAGLGFEDASAEPSIWYGDFDVILLKVTYRILRISLNNELWNNKIRRVHKNCLPILPLL